MHVFSGSWRAVTCTRSSFRNYKFAVGLVSQNPLDLLLLSVAMSWYASLNTSLDMPSGSVPPVPPEGCLPPWRTRWLHSAPTIAHPKRDGHARRKVGSQRRWATGMVCSMAEGVAQAEGGEGHVGLSIVQEQVSVFGAGGIHTMFVTRGNHFEADKVD